MPASAALPPASAGRAHGRAVTVLYAASLEEVMQDQVGPAFQRATGYSFDGFAGGSQALASEIRGRLLQADVFISASPSVNATLEGRANGNWVRKYSVFGRTYLELGYDPDSRFARQLRAKPWYEVVTERGFLLGRTDPATDPKGVLAQEELDRTAARFGLRALETDATESSDVFPEASLVGRVQSGQLDAGFFYAVEASAAHLPAVALTYKLSADYTVAAVEHSANPAGAEGFIAFLHGPTARQLLDKDGLAAP